MPRTIVVLLVSILVLPMLAGCGGSAPATNAGETEAQASRVETRTTGFDFALFRKVAEGNGTANIFLSPLSARLALAMAYNGASDEVAEGMADVLDFTGMSLNEVNATMRGLIDSLLGADESVQLEIANSIWSDDEIGFLEDFRERCVDNYDAEVASVNFQGGEAAGAINRWVDEKTHGKIKEIASAFELEKLMAMLINALYFKGTWTWEFDPAMTADAPFRLAGGGKKEVPMMHQTGEYEYSENEDFQVVSLPYGDGRLSMYVFLPRIGTSLKDFVSGLNLARWEEWMASLAPSEGAIGLPRFEMDFEADLSPALSSLGMDAAFLGDAFPGMADVRPLWIDRVIQKTYIDVNEEGTEAAAVTAVGMTMGIDEEQEPFFVMKVDRPFFFVIRDNQTDTLLFMGSVYEP